MLEAQKETLGTKQQIIDRFFKQFVEEPITVNDAADIYSVNRRTIVEWCGRGYIKIIKQGQPGIAMFLDRADVAYCAYIHRIRNRVTGVPLLDDDGNPYQFKSNRYNFAE